MEDRYLFKAKHFKEWHVGNIVKEPDGLYIRDINKDVMAFIDDPSTICQCTGLKDKNGKLIWENDIVNCTDAECCGYISWNESEAGFYFDVLLEGGRFDEEHIYDYQDCMEVIGNIKDNARREYTTYDSCYAW